MQFNIVGTATPYGDTPDYIQLGGGFLETSGFLYFEPGQATVTRSSAPWPDTEFEPDETIILMLQASDYYPYCHRSQRYCDRDYSRRGVILDWRW